MDDIAPKVKTRFKMGGFTFDVYAYRKVTEEEAYRTLGEWLIKRRRRKIPKAGYVKLFTILGFDEE